MPVLNWLGKDKVVNHHNDVPFRVLECKYAFGEPSENMLIKGDNLHALKALLPRFEGRVKCICIDPPYNTGNEGWVYNDNVNDPKIRKWLGAVVGREGEDLSRHDKWLCMMYPRLRLLQRLLADDGAIFISIDYHEQPYLRLVCDEIFGRLNFVSEIACVSKPSGRSDDKYVASAHESIIIYRKADALKLGLFEPGEHITGRYSKSTSDGKKYREEDLRKRGARDERSDRPNLFYPFFYSELRDDLIVGSADEETPIGYIRIEPMKSANVEGRWRWGQNTAKEQISYLHPRYMPNKGQWSVFEWEYLDERGGVKPTTLWDFKDVNSERGTEAFRKLGFQTAEFPNPKPVGTIERILQIATSPSDIVLDSFAGSGTTAHAALKLNKADGGNRRFILVEMEDYAETITAERVRRVIDGYGADGNHVDGTGGGFSFYELGEPLLLEDGSLNEAVPAEKICEYIWYTETKSAYTPQAEKHCLGAKSDTAYYFHYERGAVTSLDEEFLKTLAAKAGRYVIYADMCALGAADLERFNITFRKIPRDIRKITEA
jgi:adenine-specific DNA-methyltransferase